MNIFKEGLYQIQYRKRLKEARAKVATLDYDLSNDIWRNYWVLGRQGWKALKFGSIKIEGHEFLYDFVPARFTLFGRNLGWFRAAIYDADTRIPVTVIDLGKHRDAIEAELKKRGIEEGTVNDLNALNWREQNEVIGSFVQNPSVAQDIAAHILAKFFTFEVYNESIKLVRSTYVEAFGEMPKDFPILD